MERDRFKQFVNDHREALEHHEDYRLIWQQVEKGLNTQKRGLQWKRLWKAAAVLVVLITSAWLLAKYQQMHTLPLELVEAEGHYYPMVAAKMQLAEKHRAQIDELVWDDLLLLDRAYLDLKKDLKEQADNEEVIKAIIENYRIKLEILDEILTEIETKEDERQSEPPIKL